MKSIALKPERVATQQHGSLSLLLPIAAVAILSGPDVAEAAAAPRPSAAGGRTFFVDAERGDDSGCLDGLSPDPSVDPSEPCPYPGAPWPGPFKTITRALTTIELNPAGAPFTVRIAARWHEGLGTPYIYGNSPGAANYSGEAFPLLVPPRTQLRADAAMSERVPGTGVPIRVIIEGPIPPSTNAVDTLVFLAGGTDNFTPEGGLDGTEIHLDYGMEVRRGGRSVYLFADSLVPTRWPGITGGPPSLTLPAMSVRIEKVWFSGGSAYGLDAHILHQGATGRFTISNCRFSTDTTVFVDPFSTPVGQPVPHPQHTGQALIHLYSNGSPPAPGAYSFFDPILTNNVVNVVPGAGGLLPDVKWGMQVEPWTWSDSHINISGLDLDGGAGPATPGRGIAVGIELASNTFSPTVAGQTLIPEFTLAGSQIRNCLVLGLAGATGAFSCATFAFPTITRLQISGNQIIGNGVVPDSPFPSISTHFEYLGAGIHLVRRECGSEFVGSISSNIITANVVGIAYSAGGLFPLTGFGDFRIAGNSIFGQVLYPPTYVPPPTTGDAFPGAGGVGVILGDDTFPTQPIALPGGGTLGPTCILEANRISDNARHGVWIIGWNPPNLGTPSTVDPLLRNNRIFGNGTVAFPPAAVPPVCCTNPPPPCPYPCACTPLTGGAGDGVRIEVGPCMTGGIVASTLVNETIVNNANGFGVNNLGGTPVLWNSIVYNNNVGADLSGFVFGPPMAGIPTVNYTDFCGLPWPAGTTCGTLPPGGPVAGCIDLAPDFVLPAAPNFVLRCASSGTTCPNGCALPCASPCVDAGEANGPGSPKMPVVDADGFDRTVSLNQPCPPPDRPDMGATEKRTCTP